MKIFIIFKLIHIKRRNVSALIAVAVMYDTENWDDFIELVSKWLEFKRREKFGTKFHKLEEDSISKDFDPTGRYSKIRFIRKSRASTENPWREVKIEVIPSPKWNVEFYFQSFYDNREISQLGGPRAGDTTFFGDFMPRLKELFFFKRDYALS